MGRGRDLLLFAVESEDLDTVEDTDDPDAELGDTTGLDDLEFWAWYAATDANKALTGSESTLNELLLVEADDNGCAVDAAEVSIFTSSEDLESVLLFEFFRPAF